jgi:hypothetical protein
VQGRRRLLGWKLEGRGPARKLAGRPEALAERQVVGFHDDAVCLELEAAPGFFPLAAERRDLFDTLTCSPM